ncbi:hypothetical protein FD723_39770 (plasmid) [Nostoc sp. C052]|uniref:hypothetical protein n=1 Tax=Nostoc sp. C052 TaxID=2576902 RepID=UPI0015C40267|nr:hypothetical protein [Nostoc sp. C052]QLE46351.1 hypothetical protein FD723_39770 [Nostoc sp. C052]
MNINLFAEQVIVFGQMIFDIISKQLFVLRYSHEQFFSALIQISIWFLIIISAFALYIAGLIALSFIKGLVSVIRKRVASKKSKELSLDSKQVDHSTTNNEFHDYLWTNYSSDIIGLYEFYKKPEQPDYNREDNNLATRKEIIETVSKYFQDLPTINAYKGVSKE